MKQLGKNIRHFWLGIKNVYAFLKREDNKAGFSKMFQLFKRILKHLRPAKLKGRLRFGTGDPCSTGQALGILAVFYSYYGESVKIIPDFEDKIIEAQILAKGRIRMGTLLIIIIKLILDKDFKTVYHNFNQLKEEF